MANIGRPGRARGLAAGGMLPGAAALALCLSIAAPVAARSPLAQPPIAQTPRADTVADAVMAGQDADAITTGSINRRVDMPRVPGTPLGGADILLPATSHYNVNDGAQFSGMLNEIGMPVPAARTAAMTTSASGRSSRGIARVPILARSMRAPRASRA